MMAEQTQQEPKTTKRKKKRVWLAAIVSVIAVICCLLLWDLLKSKSVDEQLAAIEAARAIPDSQNAATIYNQLLVDYSEGQFAPDFLDPNTEYLTRTEPWSSEDHPELAEWLEEQQDTIAKLIEAGKREKCAFPINTDIQGYASNIDRLAPIRQLAFLLARAANHDLAEGRTDSALEKYLCLLQMGKHECQQPLMIDYLVGIAIEAVALRVIACFIVEENPSEGHLSTIEAIPLEIRERWAEASQSLLEMERLMHDKWAQQAGPIARVGMWWVGRSMRRDAMQRIQEQYLRLLVARRGNRILIALRRYKNQTSRWPQSLDEIKSSLPAEVLTDPQNGGPFVYKLTDDSFKLYSKGPNKLDEYGKYRDPQDDWPIWPPRGRKPKTKKGYADPNQSDTHMEPVQ